MKTKAVTSARMSHAILGGIRLGMRDSSRLARVTIPGMNRRPAFKPKEAPAPAARYPGKTMRCTFAGSLFIRRDTAPAMQLAAVPAADTRRSGAAFWMATVESDRIRSPVSRDAVP